MSAPERLRGIAHQLRALATAFDDLAERRVYDLRSEALVAFGWLVTLRDSVQDLERAAREDRLVIPPPVGREGEAKAGPATEIPGDPGPGGDVATRAKALFGARP